MSSRGTGEVQHWIAIVTALAALASCSASEDSGVAAGSAAGGAATALVGGASSTSIGGTISSGGLMARGGSPSASGGLLGRGGSLAAAGGSRFGFGGLPTFGGAFGVGGLAPTGGAVSVGGAAEGGAATTGANPSLPPIVGECPSFKTGTATIGGLSGISLQVGPQKAGTGSLVFYWHGTGSTANEVNTLVPAAVRQEILDQGGIIVSFQGSLGTGGDCSGTSTFSKDDFKVADLIAACAVRDYGIGARRIYTTGCSAGGLQAGCMGAMRSSYIAASVPNSGGEVTRQTIQDPTRVPAVMTMHGGSSDVVVVSFATTSATYDAHMDSAGSFVVNCNHGGGHCQAPAGLYASAWDFMKAHPFGVAPEPYASRLPSSFPTYCAAY